MSDMNERAIWGRPSTDPPPHYLQQHTRPPQPDLQSWDQQWEQRAAGVQPPRSSRSQGRPSCLTTIMRLMLMMGTVYLVLFISAGVAYAVVGQSMLRSWYLDQEPYEQEVWCNRFEKYLKSDYLCRLRADASRPDNPFIPTLSPGEDSINPEDLLLTPLFDLGTGGSDTNDSTGSPDEPIGAASTPSPDAIADASVGSAAPLPVAIVTTTPTPLPTVAPTATDIPSTTPIGPPPVSAKLELTRLTPEAQKWNNCGPTTLTMALTYYGYRSNQDPAAAFLKPNREDKNVSPWQMTRYVNEIATTSTNVRAIERIGGTMELLKHLLAAGYPVIIEKGYEVSDLGWMGHYLLLVGYDDTKQEFLSFDSYLGTNRGQGRAESYADTIYYWGHFNNTFIVIYQPWQEDHLNQVLGSYADAEYAIATALEIARNTANTDPGNKWAWFNMGDAYTQLGYYQEAAAAFEQAFRLQMPWRTLWYRFSPFEAYYHLGRYSDVLQLADSLDRTSQNYVEEAWYYRGLAYAAQGNYNQALAQLEQVIRFNEHYTPATEAINAIRNNQFTPPTAS